jgi:methyl-accepting chemotaxis protein
MVKINRIANKLGVAGLVGILLSVGMVANQSSTETSVNEANQRADIQQRISNDALKAESEMRNMQLAVRGVRLARSVAEVTQRRAEYEEAKQAQQKLLDDALALASNPQDKDLFNKIKQKSLDYSASADGQADLMLKVLGLNTKRIAVSGLWDKKLDAIYATLSSGGSPYRVEIESRLHDADGALNAIRAAGWRYFSTGEADLRDLITRNTEGLSEALKRARDVVVDKSMLEEIDSLEPLVKEFIAATEEVVKADQLKNNISKTKTVPIANETAKLLRSMAPLVEKAVADAKANVTQQMARSGQVNFGFGAAIILVLIGSAVFSFLSVARPITRLNGALGRMAAGELHVEVPGAGRGDEIGDMARTVAMIASIAEQKARDEAEAKIDQDAAAADLRRAAMTKMANDFEGAIGEIVETVSSASAELETSAGSLTATAERSQGVATMVATASEEAFTSVQSAASATEEMSSSVNEISRQVQESARIAGEAVDQARKTNDRVGELAKAAARIGDVVELINTIAGQTNLLALNATIEAARAGEAGRGFAVVASEVKALAEQTAKATGEIGQQISGIQAATEDSVSAIKEISDTIGRMSEISSTIASAVEMQGAATLEISRNVQRAAHGTEQVSTNINEVRRGAADTGSASSQVLAAAQSLSGDSNRLKREVGKFLHSVRAA